MPHRRETRMGLRPRRQSSPARNTAGSRDGSSRDGAVRRTKAWRAYSLTIKLTHECRNKYRRIAEAHGAALIAWSDWFGNGLSVPNVRRANIRLPANRTYRSEEHTS